VVPHEPVIDVGKLINHYEYQEREKYFEVLIELFVRIHAAY
jgi:hypothetical protein